jgi:hypothetical protein
MVPSKPELMKMAKALCEPVKFMKKQQLSEKFNEL